MNNKLATILLSVGLVIFSNVGDATEVCGDWPQWDSFKQHFITQSGRVVDLGSPQNITTSEGQSYGLFFALVANDRVMFDKLLNWTERHLAEGDLSARLPAWKWGKKTNGLYGILDSNPAADSDLWIAYALAEASELWQERRYAVLASVIAGRILREETAYLTDLGLTLLPSTHGFKLANDTYRLNPSYVPLQILERFSTIYDDSPWPELLQSSIKLIQDSASDGAAPDWVLHSQKRGFHFTKKHSDLGSYNAIRVYLWLGLLAQDSPYKNELVAKYQPFIDETVRRQAAPHKAYANGKFSENGPIGFSAALLPLMASSNQSGFQALGKRVSGYQPQKLSTRYYDSVLTLFGQGSVEQRYQFNKDGKLSTQWSEQCP